MTDTETRTWDPRDPAVLARLNLRVGVDELLRRTERFERATAGELERHRYPSNGLAELPLRLAASS